MNYSRIVSGLAHPILMPLYAIFLIFHSNTFLDYTPVALVKAIYMIVFITTILLPLSCLPLLKSYALISSYGLAERKDRMIPLAISILSYILGLSSDEITGKQYFCPVTACRSNKFGSFVGDFLLVEDKPSYGWNRWFLCFDLYILYPIFNIIA